MSQSFDVFIVLQFAFSTMLPIAATAGFALLGRWEKWKSLGYWHKQLIYGLAFSLVAIYGTEAGIATNDATMNVRDAAPLVAGLMFGGPAGILAGVIGGLERWFAALWGRGMLTRVACSVATAMAGVYAAVMRRYVLRGKRPTLPIAAAFGAVVEVLHLLLAILTNIDHPTQVFLVVQACNFPMIFCVALSTGLSSLVYAVVSREGIRRKAQTPDVSRRVQRGLLAVLFVGFLCSLASLSVMIRKLTATGLTGSAELLLLTVLYMEVLLLAALFLAVYLLINRMVVRSIWQVNSELGQITEGDLEARVNVRDSVEFDSLSDGINATVGALREANAAESARMERDLATAKSIQLSALPRTFPPFPDVKAFDIYASMNAAREVGGDFYDFFTVDDHTLGFLIADVSGKGIPASLFMMESKSELANYMKQGMDLAEAVRQANWNLCQGNDEGMFVTVWAAMLDYNTGKLTYVNAGHNYPLLRHNGEWQWLKVRCGVFLGTFETANYRAETIMLEPEDELMLYTDGVNEAFNVAEEEYGNDRLETFLRAHANAGPRMLIEMLLADVRLWAKGAEQSDDITMLCLEYGVPPEISGTSTVPATDKGAEELRHRVRRSFALLECPDDVRDGLVSVVDELFRNVCETNYAHALEPGDVQFAYVYDPDGPSLTMSIADWGEPFDEQTYDIYAKTAVLDDIAYVRDGNCNVVAFHKSWP